MFLTPSESGNSYGAIKKTAVGLSNMMVIRMVNTKHSPCEYLEVIGVATLVGDWLNGKKALWKNDWKNTSNIIPKNFFYCNKSAPTIAISKMCLSFFLKFELLIYSRKNWWCDFQKICQSFEWRFVKWKPLWRITLKKYFFDNYVKPRF